MYDASGTFERKWFEDPEPDPTTSSGDFGVTVALGPGGGFVGSGTAIVGDAGKVHVYKRNAFPDTNNWSFVETIQSPGSGAFGRSFGLGSGLLAIGDPLADGVVPGSGAVYLYESDFNQALSPYIPHGIETNAPVQTGDGYGSKVTFGLGTTIYAGAPQHDATGFNAGAVFMTHPFSEGPPFEGRVETISEGDVSTNEFFGHAVAIDGNVMIVGIHDDTGCGLGGAAYVYRWQGGAWKGEQRLTVEDLSEFAHFGFSVDVSGNLAVIGADRDSSGGPGLGSAHIFSYDGSDWELEESIKGPDSGNFGHAVAVHGGTVLIGAPSAPSNTAPGRAYVYTEGGGGWQLDHTLIPPSGMPFDRFGDAVDLDAQFAVVGAPSVGIGFGQGSAYVYDVTTWAPSLPRLVPADFSATEFGLDVALRDNTVLVGVPELDVGHGRVETFTFDGLSWQPGQILTASDEGGTSFRFGHSVAMDGDVAVVGAEANGPGAAYVFFHDGNAWAEVEIIDPPTIALAAAFARDVAIDGVHVAIGAPEDDEAAANAGAVYPYTFDVTFTVPECPEVVLIDEVARLTEPVPGLSVRMGESVAVSRDFAAVGMPNKSFPGTLPNGMPTVFSQVGQIHIYERTHVREWTLHSPFSPTPDTDTANSQFGFSVAMDENLLVVGSIGSDGTGGGDGAAFVFARDGNEWTSTAQLIGDDSHGTVQTFGRSVDIDGEQIVVGAPFTRGPGGTVGAGAAWVFERDTNGIVAAWNRSPTIWPAGVATADHVGEAVAISGDWVLLGVPDDDNDGSAYLFQKIGTNWVEHPTLFKAPDAASGYRFGHSVDIDGDLFVSSATFANTSLAPQSGAAYVWRYNPGTLDWDFAQKLVPATARQSESIGWDVAIDHHTIIVSALTGRNELTGVGSGAAYVFQYDTNSMTWVERPALYPSDGKNLDNFGKSVALDGGNVWVGAPLADDDPSVPPSSAFNSGSAYTFDLFCSLPGPPNPVIVEFELLPNPDPAMRVVRVVFEERGGFASSYELWRAAQIADGWFLDVLFGVSYIGGLNYEATSMTGGVTPQAFRIQANP
jgi:hypothetical protein